MAELDSICRKLNLEPQQIAREKEPAYAAIVAKKLGRAGWLKALHDNPVLIQRPIAIAGDRAIIARPTELIEIFF
jgi:arsenate reductase (glutaredoxin)